MQSSENAQNNPVPPTASPPPYGQPQQFPPPQYVQPQQFPPPQYVQPQQFPASIPFQAPVHIPNNVPQQWSTGLCDCSDDIQIRCITFCCPYITFGRIAEIVDRGSISCPVSGAIYWLVAYATGCSCIYASIYRAKLRRQYALPEEPCNDCCVHCCCGSCALRQEYRELKNRGFDVTLGWQGNIERQSQGVTMVMAPTVQEGMNR